MFVSLPSAMFKAPAIVPKVYLSLKLNHSTNSPTIQLSRALVDKFGRRHDYLRVSLTERCNLRCTYCMPEEGIQLSKREECLSLNELKRLTKVFVNSCGIKKIRLTGGEPTVDKKLVLLLEHLSGLREDGLKTVAMTTNGLTLKRQAKTFKNLGLNAINISLDTLNAKKFEQLTRRRGWNLVYQGLMTALETKFDKIKLNCVVMKNFNDNELADFARLAIDYPIEVRFIEFMPFAGNQWATARMLPYKEMLRIVSEIIPNLERVGNGSEEVSKVYKNQLMLGSIGFISSMSDNFCAGCNRLRLTADGHLKVCLFGREETSLRDLMRNGANDAEIVKAISQALSLKKKQHAGALNLQNEPSRPMIKIGARMYHSDNGQKIPCSSNKETIAITNKRFTHLNEQGQAIMVNVGAKIKVKRVARAQGRIKVGSEVLMKLLDNSMTKGDVLSVSRVAGIMGAKLTSKLIPLCHQIPLNQVIVDIEPCKLTESLLVTATVEARHNTGVEMESLTAVSVTLLTLYDMCKSINKSMVLSEIELLHKVKESDSS